jgi:predicted lipoprotein with Yx(FWY)xxD motif
MRTHLLLFMVLALASPSASLAGPAASPLPRSTLTTGPSSYGRILFDGRGFALYAFTHDPRGQSVCTGACAKAWPPFVVKRPPRAAAGAKATLLGTTKRADGTLQVTYAGRPLYHYVGDRRPGQVLCQNIREFGGVWLVIRSTGALVR